MERGFFPGGLSDLYRKMAGGGRGSWQHVCLAVGGTSGILYHNGSLAVSMSSQTTFTLSAAKPASALYTIPYLGKIVWGNDLFQGYLDEVRIFNTFLTASEVTAIYNSWVIPSRLYYPWLVLQALFPLALA
jgi:hypothetical protein